MGSTPRLYYNGALDAAGRIRQNLHVSHRYMGDRQWIYCRELNAICFVNFEVGE